MCDAVVVPSRPLNVTLTCSVLPEVSKTTVAKPVPGEALTGTSSPPERTAESVTIDALLAGNGRSNNPIKAKGTLTIATIGRDICISTSQHVLLLSTILRRG